MTASRTSKTAAPAPAGAVPSSLAVPPVPHQGLDGNAGGHRPPQAQGDGGAPRSLNVLASKMSESYLDSQIRRITDDLGLLRYHTHNSMRSPSGFPDLVIVGRGVMYRELKREREKPKPAQQKWLDRLSAAGQDVGVWHPSQLLSGQIARELAALAGVTS